MKYSFLKKTFQIHLLKQKVLQNIFEIFPTSEYTTHIQPDKLYIVHTDTTLHGR